MANTWMIFWNVRKEKYGNVPIETFIIRKKDNSTKYHKLSIYMYLQMRRILF